MTPFFAWSGLETSLKWSQPYIPILNIFLHCSIPATICLNVSYNADILQCNIYHSLFCDILTSRVFQQHRILEEAHRQTPCGQSIRLGHWSFSSMTILYFVCIWTSTSRGSVQTDLGKNTEIHNEFSVFL